MSWVAFKGSWPPSNIQQTEIMIALVFGKGMNAGKPHHFVRSCCKGLIHLKGCRCSKCKYLWIWALAKWESAVLPPCDTYNIRVVGVIQCVNNIKLGSYLYLWDFLGICLLNKKNVGVGGIQSFHAKPLPHSTGLKLTDVDWICVKYLQLLSST